MQVRYIQRFIVALHENVLECGRLPFEDFERYVEVLCYLVDVVLDAGAACLSEVEKPYLFDRSNVGRALPHNTAASAAPTSARRSRSQRRS